MKQQAGRHGSSNRKPQHPTAVKRSTNPKRQTRTPADAQKAKERRGR